MLGKWELMRHRGTTVRQTLEGELRGRPRRAAHDDSETGGGVSEGEIMKLCGWKTRAMFDRYNIIDEHDLARAVARRFNSTEQAQSTPVERDPSHVS